MDPTGRRYCTGFVIALLLVATAIRAQTRGTGAISGIVYDPTGRVIGNAEVLAVNNATHMSRLATTTSEGVFRLALLPPGTYAVSVKVPGYEVHISSSVQVTVSVTSSLPVTLVVAGANATVQVNSGSQVAVLGTATPGSLVDETAIKALLLSNRNYTQILGLSPGVIVDLPNAAQLGRGAQNVASNGATPTANNRDGAGPPHNVRPGRYTWFQSACREAKFNRGKSQLSADEITKVMVLSNAV